MMEFSWAEPVLRLMLLALILWLGVRLVKSIFSIDASLKDIAESQRILAKNPKNFEESKKIRKMTRPNDSSF